MPEIKEEAKDLRKKKRKETTTDPFLATFSHAVIYVMMRAHY